MEKNEIMLDVDISQLEIGGESHIENAVNEIEKEGSETIRRSSRKKFCSQEPEKRRVLSKPKKLVEGEFDKTVISYYLDRKIKRLPSSLETIFEQPKSDIYMSKRKLNRILPFREISSPRNKNKVKKRSMKAKKIKKPKKLPMELLLKKLANIEEGSIS